jgi:hypothetical protein
MLLLMTVKEWIEREKVRGHPWADAAVRIVKYLILVAIAAGIYAWIFSLL